MFGIPLLSSCSFTCEILEGNAAVESRWLSAEGPLDVFRDLILMIGILLQTGGIPSQVDLWSWACILVEGRRWSSAICISENTPADYLLLLLQALTSDMGDPGEQGLLVVGGPVVWHICSTYTFGVQVRAALVEWEFSQDSFQPCLVECQHRTTNQSSD